VAYFSLQARYFVDSTGAVTPKVPPVPRRVAKQVFERDGRKCRSCGAPCRFGGNSVSFLDTLKSSACDHIFPRSRGGQNTLDNLQLLCLTCNSQKGAK
jgi:5-methylcytosine-specific restriction endonuclease McrA